MIMDDYGHNNLFIYSKWVTQFNKRWFSMGPIIRIKHAIYSEIKKNMHIGIKLFTYNTEVLNSKINKRYHSCKCKT